MNDYDSYVLCTTPRSGSTLLCRLMAAAGAGVPDSYFHTPDIAAWLRALDLSRAAFGSDHAALRGVLDAALTRGRAGTGVFGLRLQRGSFAFLSRQLAVLFPGRTSDKARLEAAFGRILFIHLSRENKLDQAVSLLKANQTGLWHRAPDGTEIERTAPAAPAAYDRGEIARHLAELTALDGAWRTWFAQEGVTPMRVGYDDLSADPTGELARILARLGRDPAIAPSIAVPVARLADETSRDWASRFRAETG